MVKHTMLIQASSVLLSLLFERLFLTPVGRKYFPDAQSKVLITIDAFPVKLWLVEV